jgi:hypothetical protein
MSDTLLVDSFLPLVCIVSSGEQTMVGTDGLVSQQRILLWLIKLKSHVLLSLIPR